MEVERKIYMRIEKLPETRRPKEPYATLNISESAKQALKNLASFLRISLDEMVRRLYNTFLEVTEW